jgi:hypothetical protein
VEGEKTRPQEPRTGHPASLYAVCAGFNEYLEKKHPVKLAHDEMQFGDYLFETPTVEPVKHS